MHPRGLAPEGPARPHWTAHPSSGELALLGQPQPDSSGWHPFQLRSCFYPSERLSLEPHKTRFGWQGADVHWCFLAHPVESGKVAIRPPTEDRGILAHFV